MIVRIHQNTQRPGQGNRLGVSLAHQEEWEYACRGGPMTTRRRVRVALIFTWRSRETLLASQANFMDTNLKPDEQSRELLAKSLGIYDMHGNIGGVVVSG